MESGQWRKGGGNGLKGHAAQIDDLPILGPDALKGAVYDFLGHVEPGLGGHDYGLGAFFQRRPMEPLWSGSV